MTTAQDRGWGDPRALHFERDNIVPVQVGPFIAYGAIRLRVHRDIAPLVRGFLTAIEAQGYRLDQRADDWGYCLRANRNNPRVLSNHSWGIAIDLNAVTNPNTHDGRVHTDMPSFVPEIARRWGFEWGGDYHGHTKDPMHFEVLKSRAATQQFVKDLATFFASQH